VADLFRIKDMKLDITIDYVLQKILQTIL